MSVCSLFEQFVTGKLPADALETFIAHHHTCAQCGPAVAEHRRRFVSGALSAEAADRFRDHLIDCPVCAAALVDDVEVEMALGERGFVHPATENREAARPGFPRWASLGGAALSAVAAAAAVLLVVDVGGEPGADLSQHLGDTRALEGRFSDPSVDEHRPYDVAMSAGAEETEPLPLSVLAALEEEGDPNRLAAGLFLSGNPTRARQILESAPEDADTLNDRAALALAAGSHGDALVWASEALALLPEHEQARWNRAVALRHLELPLESAAQFEAIAASASPAWAEEARQRAAAQEQGFADRQAAYQEALETARAVSTAHAPPPDGFAGRYPGLARRALYQSARTATSASDVAAVRPLADALDAAAGGARTLGEVLDAVEAGLAADPARAEVAEIYRGLVAYDVAPDGSAQGTWPDEAGWARLLDGGYDDIALGALDQYFRLTQTLSPKSWEKYVALAAAHPDPWWQLHAIWLTGNRHYKQEDYSAALVALEGTEARCLREQGVEEPCLQLDLLRGAVLGQIGRTGESQEWMARASSAAIRFGELKQEEAVLSVRLTQRLSLSTGNPLDSALAASYVGELGRRTSDCSLGKHYYDLAIDALNNNDPDGVRRWMAGGDALLAEGCPALLRRPDRFLVLAALEHLAPLPEAEHAALLRDIAALRSELAEGSDERLALDYVEGLARIRREPDAGRRLLASITDTITGTAPVALQPVYDVLADERLLNGGTEEEAARWLELRAGVAAPLPCQVYVSSAIQTLVVAARDEAGQARAARLVLPPRVAYLEPEAVVPVALREHVAACEQVSVVTAEIPYYGDHRLLPPELAWSFRSPQRAEAPPAGEAGERLVIAALEPPAAMGLPPLLPPQDVAGARVLRDEAATPERVQAEMERASLIEVYAHGIVADDQSAAALVLSPGADGKVTLTTADIRATPLRGRPLVLLVACNGGQSGDRAGGLGDAFIAAGATAVVASSTELRSRTAGAAFDTLRRETASGTPPAIALRDLRIAGVEGASSLVLFQ